MKNFLAQAVIRLSFAAAVGLLVYGCASVPVPSSEAKPATRVLDQSMLAPEPGFGVLAFKRDRSFEGGGCDHQLSLDGKPFVDLRREELIRIHVASGEHIIGAKAVGLVCFSSLREVSIQVKSGTTQVFRTAGDSVGGVLIMPTTTQ